MSFNTGNDLPSLDERDLYDNATNLDKAMNSTDPTWTDRFGVEKPTIDAALKSAGFMPAGFDFVTGGTLQPGDRNKAVYNPAPNGDNNWYRWNGGFPKVVPANSQPEPKNDTGWVPVDSDKIIREDLLQGPLVIRNGIFALRDHISVKDYLAVGDGVADDTQSFQLTINTGRVFIPRGKYRITSKLYVKNNTSIIFDDGVEIIGSVAGMMFAIDQYTENTIGGYDQCKNLAFICPNGRAKIDLGGVLDGQSRGLFSPTHTENIIFSNLTIVNGHKTHIIEFNSCKNVLVENCHFDFNYPLDYNGVYGYEIIQIDFSSQSGAPHSPPWDGTPCENIIIRNCRFDNCESAIGAHAVNPDITKPHLGVQFIGNYINNALRPIKCTNFANSIVQGNIIRAPFQRGILVNSCKNLTVTNNTIEWIVPVGWVKPAWWDGNTTGIVVNSYVPNSFDSDLVVISNNVIFCSNYDDENLKRLNSGMFIKGVSDVLISGNTIKNSAAAAVYLESNCNDITVSDNSAYDCGRVSSDVFVYNDTGSNQKGMITYSGNYSQGIPVGSIFSARVNGSVVRFLGNTFGENVTREKMFSSLTVNSPGVSINDMEYIWSGIDGVVDKEIILPRDIRMYTSLYVGNGAVDQGTYSNCEFLPFDRATGFRIGDYIKFVGLDSKVVRINVVDYTRLKVVESGTHGIRSIAGKRL